jgi:hypothetical protein
MWVASGVSITRTHRHVFEARDGRTLMTTIQTGFPTTELRDEHARGAPNAFARLERVIHASK